MQIQGRRCRDSQERICCASVLEIGPGRDGTVRAAIVTVPRGTSSNSNQRLRRPIQHLIATEVKP